MNETAINYQVEIKKCNTMDAVLGKKWSTVETIQRRHSKSLEVASNLAGISMKEPKKRIVTTETDIMRNQ